MPHSPGFFSRWWYAESQQGEQRSTSSFPKGVSTLYWSHPSHFSRFAITTPHPDPLLPSPDRYLATLEAEGFRPVVSPQPFPLLGSHVGRVLDFGGVAILDTRPQECEAPESQDGKEQDEDEGVVEIINPFPFPVGTVEFDHHSTTNAKRHIPKNRMAAMIS